METLGERIRSIRLNKGMNKSEFGRVFDATGSLVNKWENHNVSPSEDRLKQIAEFGNYSIDELLYGKPISLHDELIKRFKKYHKEKKDFFRKEIELMVPAVLHGLTFMTFGKERQNLAIEERIKHNKNIDKLEKFGYKYLFENFKNYKFDEYLKDFPDSDPQEFEIFKEKMWQKLKGELDDFWYSLEFAGKNYDWINKRFTDQIADELNKISQVAIKEDKEHYYINKIVQPFLDQAAKDFKKYIKENTDIE